MKYRLHKLMETEGLSPAKFADEIGVQRSSISHIISGRNKPSYDFIIKILNRFKGINAEWLLTGEGSMIKGQESPLNTVNTSNTLFSAPPLDVKNSTDYQETLISSNKTDSSGVKTDSIKENTDVKSKADNASTKIKVTDVNNVDYILVFYEDGTFKQYNSRE